ncbi:MAG: hypothetical protein VYC42_01670 [Pseudomonadota bacterium]|nr:hypothetical protein [Pseudomonadota bacterium]
MARRRKASTWLKSQLLRDKKPGPACSVDLKSARSLRDQPEKLRDAARDPKAADRLVARIQRFRAKQARAKHVPPPRPRRRRHPARSGDLGRYETLKAQWIDAHPSATAAEIGEAVRRIAAACGV